MSAADDAWLALKGMENDASCEYRKRSNFRQKGDGSKEVLSVDDIMRGVQPRDKKKSKEKKSKKKKSEKEGADADSLKKKDKKKKSESTEDDAISHALVPVHASANDSDDNDEERDSFLEDLTAQEMMQKISRDLNVLSDSPNSAERRAAINRVHDVVTGQGTLGSGFKKLGPGEYNEVFQAISKPIFKRFADPVERCRERAFRITRFLFSNAADFVPVLGYFFPALMARAPPRLGFDEDMKVFVANFDQHDEYRRGRAVDRQDAPSVEGGTGALTHTVVEPSEEVRLLAAQSLLTLLQRLVELDCLAVLSPYFADLVLFLQCQTRDLFPELKVVAARALETLALLAEFESGMCFFAVALVRALLPLLRHRHAKVRVAGIDALRACMIVPNRAKRKGAGTEAMVDLVGFKEDNVLNIASFYKPSVSVNYLAELTSDPAVGVRERLVRMLSTFLVDLEDRYDHQQRLLPYLLDMLTDESPSVSGVALAALVRCGELYEEQHADDIIERRQFGIDGDDRCNLEKPLPAPFTERPRIGIRIYTRGNTKRFIFALVGELTNWQSKTRLKSANLLKMVTVLCEEYLTMEMHKLLPSYIKALQYAREDGDKDLEAVLCEVFELSGRYTAPDSFVHYILPRLRGDVEVVQFNMDVASRCCVIDVLKCFLDGAKDLLIPPYLAEIIDVLVDPFVIDPSSEMLHTSALRLLVMLLSKVQGRGLAVTAAHFQTTGRLKNMKESIHKAFRFVLHSLSSPSLRAHGAEAMILLSNLDADSHITAHGVQGLVLTQAPAVVHSLIAPLLTSDEEQEGVCVDDIYDLDSPETRLMELVLLCPVLVLQRDYSSELFGRVLSYLTEASSALTRVFQSTLVSSASSAGNIHITSSTAATSDNPSALLKKYADFMLYLLHPFLFHSDCDPEAGITATSMDYFGCLPALTPSPPLMAADIARTRSQLEGFVSAIVSSFVTPMAWGRDAGLQMRSLAVLSSLLCITTKSGDRDRNLEVVDPLLQGGGKELMGIFRSSVAASSPLEVRLSAAELFSNFLFIFRDDSCRLVSYARQKEKLGSAEEEESRKDRMEAMQAAISIAITIMLDDGNDRIRVLALESLGHVLHFVRPHYDPLLSPASASPAPIATNSLPSFVPGSTSFEGIVEALLLRAVNGNPTEEFLGHLDLVLRSLAVLDLEGFEGLVRGKLPLLVGLHAPPSPASELLSGLLDHVEVLAQFRAK